MLHKDKPEYNRNPITCYPVDELVEDSYSSDNGRLSLDPVLLMNIPIIQSFYFKFFQRFLSFINKKTDKHPFGVCLQSEMIGFSNHFFVFL